MSCLLTRQEWHITCCRLLWGVPLPRIATKGKIATYRVLRKLGEGGIGSIYEVEQLFIARCVAIKVLHLSYSCDSEALARFCNEARVTYLIESSSILRIRWSILVAPWCKLDPMCVLLQITIG